MEWADVDSKVKNNIWETILETFDVVPNTEFIKKKVIEHVGVLWNGFKTRLTSQFVFGEQNDESPCGKYAFLDDETWKKFKQSRSTPAFQEKRKHAQEIQSKNLYPHTLSRGGYPLLREKILEEKEKEIREASQSDPLLVVDPPSSPERHELWKRARQRRNGKYTSEEARVVAEKIDSLEEQSSQGTFVPHGREDILAIAIGRPEHPGRVRGLERGVGIRLYFGHRSHYRRTSEVVTKEDLAIFSEKFTQNLTEKLTKKIRQDMMQELASMGYSQQSPNSNKASCSVAEQTFKENEHDDILDQVDDFQDQIDNFRDQIDDQPDPFDDIQNRCKLYVDNPYHIVAIGRVFNLGSVIHNKSLENDMVRVVVEEVRHGGSQVPMPTDEVQTVRQALNNFIQWPRRLLKPFSNKDLDKSRKDVPPKRSRPQLNPIQELMILMVPIKDPIQLKLEHDPTLQAFYLSRKEVMDLCSGNQMLTLSVVQFWLMYLHRQCTMKGNSHLYGFIDPQHILTPANRSTRIDTFIQERLHKGNKEFYLAPYLDSLHWQLLIICPRSNEVVLLCSADERKLNETLKHKVNTAMEGYNKLMGYRKKTLTWIFPNSRKQSGGTECGFYVMRHMFNIVSASIVDLWAERFNNTEPFAEDDLYDIRDRWARLFLDLYPSRIIGS